MSLMQLLTVGQCFKEVEDRPSAYKVEASHSLPRFTPGTRVNSVAVRKPVEPALESTQGSLFAELVAAPALENAKAQPVIATKPAQPAPPLEKPVSAPAAAKPAPTNVSPHSVFLTKRKENKWKTMVKELFFGRTPRRRSNGTNVQGELVLENVTVVRNDLNETDLEVVQPRTQAAASSIGAAAESKPVVPPHKHARDWVSLTAKLLSPKKSEFYPSQGYASVAEQNRTPDLIARR